MLSTRKLKDFPAIHFIIHKYCYLCGTVKFFKFPIKIDGGPVICKMLFLNQCRYIHRP